MAIFRNDHIEELFIGNFNDIWIALKKISFSSGIISNVGNEDYTKRLLSFSSKLIQLSYKLKYPVDIKYNSFSTLGLDRIANAMGAFSLYPNKENLIIDIGTCITYDFINQKNQYLGGSISPGFQLRSNALNSYTENLPNLEILLSPKPLIGDNTKSSIESGIVNGVLAEIKKTIEDYIEFSPEINIILTGGDTAFIKSMVSIKKNSIFAHENLTLIGLNAICKYNV
jgi:type III pantothenate kinase